MVQPSNDLPIQAWTASPHRKVRLCAVSGSVRLAKGWTTQTHFKVTNLKWKWLNLRRSCIAGMFSNIPRIKAGRKHKISGKALVSNWKCEPSGNANLRIIPLRWPCVKKPLSFHFYLILHLNGIPDFKESNLGPLEFERKVETQWGLSKTFFGVKNKSPVFDVGVWLWSSGNHSERVSRLLDRSVSSLQQLQIWENGNESTKTSSHSQNISRKGCSCSCCDEIDEIHPET